MLDATEMRRTIRIRHRVVARNQEKHEPFPLNLIHSLKDWTDASAQKKPIILTFQIEKKRRRRLSGCLGSMTFGAGSDVHP